VVKIKSKVVSRSQDEEQVLFTYKHLETATIDFQLTMLSLYTSDY